MSLLKTEDVSQGYLTHLFKRVMGIYINNEEKNILSFAKRIEESNHARVRNGGLKKERLPMCSFMYEEFISKAAFIMGELRKTIENMADTAESRELFLFTVAQAMNDVRDAFLYIQAAFASITEDMKDRLKNFPDWKPLL